MSILPLVLAFFVFACAPLAKADGDAARGEYVFQVAGCKGCHTAEEGGLVAGGRALETPFGVFYTPNITPDKKHGLGGWSLSQFETALRKGRGKYGLPYYPVFPYTSYKRMSDADIADLFAYLSSLPAVAQPNRSHELTFPFSLRPLMWGWQLLFFSPEREQIATGDPVLDRGAYLVRALGHCGECHTPRNRLGVLDGSRELAGTLDGPEGEVVPNITPDKTTGIGDWVAEDLDALLSMGMLPDGDFIGGSMGEVVDNTTSMLTDADRAAMVKFLRAIPAYPNPALKKP